MMKYFLIPTLMMSLNLGAVENTSASSTTGEFVWNELATTNVQGAKNFYAKVFGWEFIEKKADDMTYTIIKKGAKEFGGIWAIPTAQQNHIPPHWLSYIGVENIEKSLEMARRNGATVVKSVQKVGEMGLFAIIKDPTGAYVALWQPLNK